MARFLQTRECFKSRTRPAPIDGKTPKSVQIGLINLDGLTFASIFKILRSDDGLYYLELIGHR